MTKTLFYSTGTPSFHVNELSDKHLAAINRGRKAAGLKPIRRKKKTSTKKKLPKIIPKNEMRKKWQFLNIKQEYLECQHCQVWVPLMNVLEYNKENKRMVQIRLNLFLLFFLGALEIEYRRI